MTYIVNHEDIWIESTDPLSWRQFFDTTLNYDNLSINFYEYTDYQPTQLQFQLSSDNPRQTITCKIKYANRLTRTHAKYAIVCHYDAVRAQWTIIPHTLNTVDCVFEFETAVIGTFCVFVNHYWYSAFTQRLADEYPNWTEIRQNTKSVGQQFLNFFGIEFETILDYLDWIQEQKYIGTADLKMYDWIYQYAMPPIQLTDTIQVYRKIGSTTLSVPILENLQEFFYNDRNQGGLFDYRDAKFYTTRQIGILQFDITRNEVTTSYTVSPMDFHIWNTFDEFGLLLGVERHHLEKNAALKERILDVFRYPSGTHDIGLTHGIARDLSLIQRKDKYGKDLIWIDDTKDLFLLNTNAKEIDIRTLRVDNQPLQLNEYEQDESKNIRIYAKQTGLSHTVSFIYGIKKYQLYDDQNTFLRRLMFEADGQATPTLLTWVEYINTVAPIMWDRFNWDEGFWDTIDKKLTGLGYVPNIWDSNIDSWKDYIFESDR